MSVSLTRSTWRDLATLTNGVTLAEAQDRSASRTAYDFGRRRQGGYQPPMFPEAVWMAKWLKSALDRASDADSEATGAVLSAVTKSSKGMGRNRAGIDTAGRPDANQP